MKKAYAAGRVKMLRPDRPVTTRQSAFPPGADPSSGVFSAAALSPFSPAATKIHPEPVQVLEVKWHKKGGRGKK